MTSTLWQRLRYGCRKIKARAEWPKFAGPDWPQHIMRAEVTDRFHVKQGRSTGRWILLAGGGKLSVYLKRHYRLPRWRGILALLWPKRSWSPALREADNLRWAAKEGFAVPSVMASLESIGPWGRLQSMLAVKELAGMLPLHQAIPLAARVLPPLVFQKWKQLLITELARLSRELHRRRCYHKDLYLCHFYLPRTDIVQFSCRQIGVDSFRGRLHMIDLHRLARHPWTWPIWLIKDLAQLAYSTYLKEINGRDRALFWRLYREGKKRTIRIRLLETLINWKWQRYRRHNEKRGHGVAATTDPVDSHPSEARRRSA